MSFGEAQRDRHNLARLGDTPPPGWLTPENVSSVSREAPHRAKEEVS